MFIAVDTNVLLDHAFKDERVVDAIQIIRERVKNVRLIVTPTVLHELAWQADHAKGEKQRAAFAVFDHLLVWGYEPLNLIPAGHGVVEQIGLKLRMSGLISEMEVNDSLVLAEAALVGCDMLLTSDHHLLEAQASGKLHGILKDCSVEGDRIVVGSPWTIVRKFFRSR